jgi:hypothetical protein
MAGLVRNTLLAVAGYGVAVIIAAFFCLLVIFPPDQALSGDGISRREVADFLNTLMVGVSITASTAWPGFIATLAVARRRGYRSKVYFAACGVATAVLAVLLFGAFMGDGAFVVSFLSTTPAIYVGGLAGGLAYGLPSRRFRIFERQQVSATA